MLDFGCGTGDHVTYPLAAWGTRCWEWICTRRRSIQGIAADISRRPVVSYRGNHDLNTHAQFDLVVCSEVLEHVHHPRQFHPLTRVLVPGGGMIITTPNGYGAFEWFTSLQKLLARVGIHGVLQRIGHACSGPRPAAPSPDPAWTKWGRRPAFEFGLDACNFSRR